MTQETDWIDFVPGEKVFAEFKFIYRNEGSYFILPAASHYQ